MQLFNVKGERKLFFVAEWVKYILVSKVHFYDGVNIILDKNRFEYLVDRKGWFSGSYLLSSYSTLRFNLKIFFNEL